MNRLFILLWGRGYYHHPIGEAAGFSFDKSGGVETMWEIFSNSKNMSNFQTEKEGQADFYNKLRVFDGTIPTIEDNTDWVIRWTIIEFKTTISNINSVLSQSIKYLSRMRNLGKKIPAQILLVSLNNEKAYLFYKI